MKYKECTIQIACEADSLKKQVKVMKNGKVLGIEHTPFENVELAFKWAKLMIDIGYYPYQSTLDDW